jgi:thiol-disulfide isomerase/thioredoxin
MAVGRASRNARMTSITQTEGRTMSTALRRIFVMGALGMAALAAITLPRPRVAAAKPAPGAEAGDPGLIDLAGYNDLLERYRGKAVMVNFWATWAEPCRTEYPMIVGLAKEFGPQGLVVIGVSMDEDSDMNLVRHFIGLNHPEFPNYRQRHGTDPDAFYQGVNPQWRGTMPQTDFYARDGHMARYFIGDRPKDAFVQAVRLILAMPVGQNHPRSSSAVGN